MSILEYYADQLGMYPSGLAAQIRRYEEITSRHTIRGPHPIPPGTDIGTKRLYPILMHAHHHDNIQDLYDEANDLLATPAYDWNE